MHEKIIKWYHFPVIPILFNRICEGFTESMKEDWNEFGTDRHVRV